MEKLDTAELFEKYRHLMDGEKKIFMKYWDQESLVEEFIRTEGYGHGVVLFLSYIGVITDGEFVVHSYRDGYRDYDDYGGTYDEIILKRKDGKLFKCDVCVQYGEYDKKKW